MNAPTVFDVPLGKRSYPIIIGDDLTGQIRQQVDTLVSENVPVALIADDQLAELQAPFMKAAFGDIPVLTLPAGETTKDLVYLERIFTFLAEMKMDRSGWVIALGGGVIGDLVGFAAATYLRGVKFIQIPTTLLAMTDSSVGGKTGINIPQGKNLVGAFYQPQAVYVSLDLLKSLPGREFAAGMAEVIKYGMLGDLSLFERLESLGRLTPDHPELGIVVEICCRNKAAVVEADERETGSSGGRALLNLGHTFGHAIEKVAGYGVYLHGEAVAIGLILATRLSIRLGLIPEEIEDRVAGLIEVNQLPTSLEEPLSLESLKHAMLSDKKVMRGKLKFIVMEALGRVVTRSDVDEAVVDDVLRTATDLID
ncbi:MAG: 3-dehydroquinate synthase [Opitutales bacterium]|nr:3-dehydroquinate synthase [Opitutales bacterium]